MVQLGARWYDPELGRFLQPDIIVPDQYNPQTLNRYAYALNNPVRYTDPTGHCSPEYETCGPYASPPNQNFVPTETPPPAAPTPSGDPLLPTTDPGNQRPDKDKAPHATEMETPEPTQQAPQQQPASLGHDFIGISFSYMLGFGSLFGYGGRDLIIIPDTMEEGLFKFGSDSNSHYQSGMTSPDASLSVTLLSGQGLRNLGDYSGRAETEIGSLDFFTASRTKGVDDPNVTSMEVGVGVGVPFASLSKVTTDWNAPMWTWSPSKWFEEQLRDATMDSWLHFPGIR